jgi:hypothetical protein
MNNIMNSLAIQSIKAIFQTKTEHNVIIDPFSCLIKLSLLRFLDSGTKISINQNCLYFNSPTYIQGIVRFIYGDNREHLHNLYLPIQKCVEWYWDDQNTDMIYIFNNAVIGLKMLKNSYSEYATIQHTIDYYIIILMQKNATLIAKMGISSIDIDKLTSELLDETTHLNTLSNIKLNSLPNTQNTSVSNTPNTQNNSSPNTQNTEHKNKNKNKQQNREQNREQNKEQNRDQEQPEITKEIHNPHNTNEDSYQSQIDRRNSNKLKDIHRFLFDLWNKREIDIVINLYKELENKQNTEEKNSIYTNIMNYCSMKETKLNKYIEQNSSVL